MVIVIGFDICIGDSPGLSETLLTSEAEGMLVGARVTQFAVIVGGISMAVGGRSTGRVVCVDGIVGVNGVFLG
jgi:hypothetical protein